jgi:HAD superfamily hydrolase (TIGR01509 family)
VSFPACVIFDMDGTLVDSETLCARAFTDLLDTGPLTTEHFREAYRGWRLADTFADLEANHGIVLPEDFADTYRAHTDHLYRTEARPFDGVAKALAALDRPLCVASNAPAHKVRLAVEATGLAGFFGDNLHSAYDVGAWKPDPTLFLAAAKAMGAAPGDCLVVEDSAVGLEAAARAGMRAILFQPEEGAEPPVPHFRHYDDLLALVARL